jgi:hypothetical protein
MSAVTLVVPGEPCGKGRGHKKASDEDLIKSYQQTRSVWKTAKQFGMCGQSVQERLAKVGVVNHPNILRPEEKATLLAEYESAANAGKLDELAKRLGRTKHILCRYAQQLGLTDKKRKRKYISTWKYMERDEAEKIFRHFQSSRAGMKKYCIKHGYDDLGFSRTMREFFPDEWEAVMELKAPKTSMYKLGRAFEYRVRDHMKKHGYFVVRSPQSKSPVDLTCVRHGSIVFIQCKRGGALGVSEWNEFYTLALSVGADPVAAMMPDNSSRGIELKRITGFKDGSKKAQPWAEYVILPMEEKTI